MPSVVMPGVVPVAMGRTLGQASKASTHDNISRRLTGPVASEVTQRRVSVRVTFTALTSEPAAPARVAHCRDEHT